MFVEIDLLDFVFLDKGKREVAELDGLVDLSIVTDRNQLMVQEDVVEVNVLVTLNLCKDLQDATTDLLDKLDALLLLEEPVVFADELREHQFPELIH